MKKFILSFISFLCINILMAQEVPSILQMVAAQKSEGATFVDVQKVCKKSRQLTEVKGLVDASDAFFFEYDQEYVQDAITKSQPEAISIPMVLDPHRLPYTLDLVEVPESFYGYQVVTSSGQKRSANINTRHYRGVVRGKEEQSFIAMSFARNQMTGVISIQGKGSYNIGRLSNSLLHIVYHETNLANPTQLPCGTDTNPAVVAPDHGQMIRPHQRNIMSGRCLRIHLETRYNIFQYVHHGSVSAVEDYATMLFNAVSAIYQNEGINFLLHELRIWDQADPYTSIDPNNPNADPAVVLLNSFASDNSGINGHMGQLLTFEDLVSAAGIAFVRTGGWMCDTSGERNVSVTTTSVLLDPISYIDGIGTMAHEFGHTLGSRHTHDCVWGPAGNTQIDDCGNELSGSNPGPCYDPNNPILPSSGTIMSYCNTINSIGRDLSLGFGPQPGNLIRANIDAANCVGQHYGLIDFQLKDILGREREVYCWKQFIYFYGSAQTPISFYQLRLFYFEPSTNTWEEMPDYLEYQGAFTTKEIVAEFEDIGVVFESGVAYKLVLLSDHPTCGVLSLDRDFSFKEPSVKAAYNFETIQGQHRTVFCQGQLVYLDGQASDDGAEYCLNVERRPIGSTGAYEAVVEDCENGLLSRLDFSGWMSSRGFPLQGEYEYRVGLTVIDECNVVSEEVSNTFQYYGELLISAFDIEDVGGDAREDFCSYEWVFIDGEDAVNETRFRIDVSRNPIGDPNSVELISEWVEGQIGHFNFSDWMLSRGFPLEAGFEYDVRIVVSNNCFSEMDAFSRRFVFNQCCSIPTNLSCAIIDGETFLTWEDVSPNSTYWLFIDATSGICCGNEDGVSPGGILVNGNSYNIRGIRAECFEWRVQAICGDLTSNSSTPRCMTPNTLCLEAPLGPGELPSLTFQDRTVPPIIAVTPNPASDQVMIEVKPGSPGPIQLDIINVNGQILQWFNPVAFTDQPYEQKWAIPSGTSGGIYFARVHTETGTYYKKFIILE